VNCGYFLEQAQDRLPPLPPGVSGEPRFSSGGQFPIHVIPISPVRSRARLGWIAIGLIVGLSLNLLQGPENLVWRSVSQAVSPFLPGPEREVPTVAPPSGGEADFFLYDNAGFPTGFFSPCESVEFQVNKYGEPEGARELMLWALDELSRVTGLDLKYAGETRESFEDWNAKQAPEKNRVGVYYLPQQEFAIAARDSDSLFGGGPIGYAGPAAISIDFALGVFIATGGDAVFSTQRVEELIGEGGMEPSFTNQMALVYLHEFAHVLGLTHVDLEDHLMHPVLDTRFVKGFAEGDLRGLATAGSGPCGVDEDGNLLFGN
jgi:hypothetical protein